LTPEQDLRRATALFDIEWHRLDTLYVDSLWQTKSVPHKSFISTASSFWEICVWSAWGKTHVTVRGPALAASVTPIPPNAEFFGIRFKLGTILQPVRAAHLVDRDLTLPRSGGHSFKLDNTSWEIPSFENADVFVDRLVRAGLLVRDPLVQDVLQDRPLELSLRSVQRRVKSATGLSLVTIRQIERAEAASALLDQGVSILDTVLRTGYADQAHLTRSLKRFIGQTPAQIARTGK
jgi:hypothetical protein